MNINKLLTVSVASYNVERYLERTLASMCDPRYLDDIEVLVIDDGSRDRTGKIALRYQNSYPNTFRYIKKENGGHGSTINKGIELASGKYFKVIDGDDWVDSDMFAEFIRLLSQSDADMVLSDMRECDDSTGKIVGALHIEGIVPNKLCTWEETDINRLAINSLAVRTELLRSNNVHITEKCYYVDFEYNMWCIYLSKTVEYFELPIYMYRINSSTQSINRKNVIKNTDMLIKTSCNNLSLYLEFAKDTGLPAAKEKLLYTRVLRSVVTTLKVLLLCDSPFDSKRKIEEYENTLMSFSKDVFDSMRCDRLIRVIRAGHYSLVPAVWLLYRVKRMAAG